VVACALLASAWDGLYFASRSVVCGRYPGDPTPGVAAVGCGLLAILMAVWALCLKAGRLTIAWSAPVAVLSILLVIAGVGWVRDQPHDAIAMCMSNLKQLGLASMMYAEDHGDRLPRAEVWPGAICPYLKNARLYKCPLDSRPGAWLSYGANERVGGVNTAKVPHPDLVIWLFDADQVAGLPGMAAWRHRDKTMANFCFVDGHVKLMSRQDLIALGKRTPTTSDQPRPRP
jgi:prepilin-type processing-associated H-X9-DG protein